MLQGGEIHMNKKGWLRHLDFIIVDILAIEWALALTYLLNLLFFHYPQHAVKFCSGGDHRGSRRYGIHVIRLDRAGLQLGVL